MKIVIVTGASSGMGRETVLQLAKANTGADEIWVISRREERLLALKQELQDKMPLRVFALDLAKDEGIAAFAAALEQAAPQVRMLVNAAGYGKMCANERVCYEDATGMVEINCRSLVAVTQLVLPYMGEGGRILQYASSAGFLPLPGAAIYAATKAFVLSYSRALNEELRKRKIIVTAVCPGPVDTEFFKIAGMTGSIKTYKKLVMADAKKVAARALRDSARGRAVSVYGAPIKALRVLVKIVPRGAIVRLLGRSEA